MKKGLKHFILFAMGLTLIYSCKKDGLLDYDGLEHTSEWLLPVVKTEITAEQASKLNNLNYDIDLDSLGIPSIDNIPNMPVTIPPFTVPTIGPEKMVGGDSIYKRYRAEEVTLTLYITNNYPFNIKAGTKIEIEDTVTNSVVYEGTLQNDIPGKGGQDSIVVSQVTNNQWVGDGLAFYFRNFSSDGSSQPQDLSTYNSIELKININVKRINAAELYGGLAYDLVDTLDFGFGGDAGNTEEAEESNFKNGKFSLFIKNSAPLSYDLQAYFLDANYNIVDSLFDTGTRVEAPPLDASGGVILSSVEEQKVEAEITGQQYLQLKARTQHVQYKIHFTSGPNIVKITTENKVGLHLVADIKTKVSL